MGHLDCELAHLKAGTATDDCIVVTGGAGYIGSHTCKAPRVAGFVPVSYDNLERGSPEAVLWGDFELGDFADI
jgi:UDP-glucose 4-epimerase